ncbi:transcriptional regulator [Bifidobacterium merycicum]|uniref:Transcriptional regulator n=1 Tax=Bifidobacterium merycicum TaxID=78345 RepID=A0A087BHG1_9BIFI|nr:helix-turn-helix transcriptional regulator [Bifidobacterium merycicum]KFI70461.1 transcriptional regulator [Bifidobacterium merycicum]
MGVGDRIRALRKSAGLTQKELAASIGLTESAVRNYELGLRTPSEEQLAAMAESIGVAPEALMDIRVESAREALEVLFRMEETLGWCLKATGPRWGLELTLAPSRPPVMHQSLVAWKHMRDSLEDGSVTPDEYAAWKASFTA